MVCVHLKSFLLPTAQTKGSSYSAETDCDCQRPDETAPVPHRDPPHHLPPPHHNINQWNQRPYIRLRCSCKGTPGCPTSLPSRINTSNAPPPASLSCCATLACICEHSSHYASKLRQRWPAGSRN